MSEYASFCHSPLLKRHPGPPLIDTQFIFWKDGDFGLCFEEIFILSLSYSLLSLVSALYAGLYRSRNRRQRPSLGLLARGILVTILGINSITKLVSSFWLIPSLSYSLFLSQSLSVLAWIIHSLSLFVLSFSPTHTGLGPLPLNLTWGLTLLSTILRFRSVVHYLNHGSTLPSYLSSSVIQITTYIEFGVQVVYVFLLFVPAGKHRSSHTPLLGSTQFRQGEDEEEILDDGDELLVTSHGIQEYGSVRPHPTLRRFRLPDASEDRANPLSLLSFWWVQPLMKRGSLGLLRRPQDLPLMPKALWTSTVRERFQRIFNPDRGGARADTELYSLKSMDRLSVSHSSQPSLAAAAHNTAPNNTDLPPPPPPHRQMSLVRALNWSFGLHYYPLGIMKLVNDVIGFGGPLLLHQLVAFMENRTEPMSHGYYYALGLFLSTLLTAVLNAHFTYQVNKVCIKIRGSLVTEIFRKSLSVSTVGMGEYSTGQVVNHMSTDVDRIVNFCPSFHQFWSLPFQISVSLYLLYRQVGLAFIAGVVFCILLIPVNRWLAKKIGELSTKMMTQKDNRVKLMTEILTGIRVIKFYAWEKNFADKVNNIRSSELKSLAGRKYLDALCVYFWATTPVLISIMTFSTYVALGHKLTAAKVFTSLALFNMLISPLNAFPWVLNGLVEAWVSVKRVQEFLRLPEIDPSSYYLAAGAYPESLSSEERDAVSISNASFSWRREEERGDTFTEWSLKNIDISIKRGSFVGVTGKVGSGKSSLLSAITAEMRKIRGKIYVSDLVEGFGLSSQESWIQYATVKENILFGLPYDPDRYAAVVYACALEEDLKSLPAGDQTEVGENGVTLSGGQKARLALARAVYQDKDVYLLDDPLAAVDAHVASHLYTHCITGLLKNKTRILCTHHIRFLQETDCVIVLSNGGISLTGAPATVLPLIEGNEFRPRKLSGSHKQVTERPAAEVIKEEDESMTDGVLVKEEEMEEGVVKVGVYWSYWVSVGLVLAPAVLLSLFLMQASRNVSDWWLSFWISHTRKDERHNLTSLLESAPISTNSQPHLSFYLGIYGGLAAANTLFTLLRAFLYAYGGLEAARVLHKKLLSAILGAPVWFFDINPIGRIVNRFSSDLYAIDDSLPFILNILLAQLFGLMGTLIITCYGLPWFLVLLVPLAIIYYYIQKYYRRTSRELKRLSTVTLSPVYAHFQETLTGLTTIRALRATKRFMKENETKLDMSQRANYGSYAVAQWLSIRLQMLGVAMVGGVAFIAVLEHHFAGSVDPGLVGLAISYALSVTNLLSGVVTSFTETEKEMVSVERAMQYIRGAPVERNNDNNNSPPIDWPTRGVIEFQRVVLKYREGLAPALKGISINIRSAEKVGVVGRTGAGKSSLFQALFRMIDPLESGAILIDAINISTVSLDRLR
ncbi:PREDICTED: multidrug resistance-associated protein 7-like isoform X1 [Amphimedon queenslandica]|uniref:ABC-type xenobiotic transporter n=1 Tax=Amphimedon queenslandica TaxID=400682 RepID=A0A1X7UR56_AMPQE|nr:PREDICTED: multidrug resistance-associated protein 7-like isoform X1 [Amphimedon queenslandica]|eukprot:XP_011404304.1 PREDICTED: multidrug resistance-associated protein 7-like isoform X1 [Amphimedon queenslandica]